MKIKLVFKINENYKIENYSKIFQRWRRKTCKHLHGEGGGGGRRTGTVGPRIWTHSLLSPSLPLLLSLSSLLHTCTPPAATALLSSLLSSLPCLPPASPTTMHFGLPSTSPYFPSSSLPCLYDAPVGRQAVTGSGQWRGVCRGGRSPLNVSLSRP